MDKELADEILRNIETGGTAEKTVNDIISYNGENLSHILDLNSGSPRLQRSVVKKFDLAVFQPKHLSYFNSFEIRCALCKIVIMYPCWYYSIEYDVNHFHYFICFDPQSPSKPSTRCYRKG